MENSNNTIVQKKRIGVNIETLKTYTKENPGSISINDKTGEKTVWFDATEWSDGGWSLSGWKPKTDNSPEKRYKLGTLIKPKNQQQTDSLIDDSDWP